MTDATKDAKKELEMFFKKANQKVEPVIKKFLREKADPSLRELLYYTIATGGKRLRPALTILSCEACGGEAEQAITSAAGLELIHNYSLIIDDIIDNGLIRRGKPTLWAKYGHAMAECLAIDFAASIFQSANSATHTKEITDLFAVTLKKIVEGEILDILFERKVRANEPYFTKEQPKKIEEKDYLQMIKKKTASLLSACCEAGVISSGSKNVEYKKALINFGYNLGIAFQLQDDILDIFAQEKKFGKKIGKDIEEGKGGNIVILLAQEELPGGDKAALQKILKQEEINQADIKKAMEIINKTKAQVAANTLKEQFIKKAKHNLSVLKESPAKDMLFTLADFVIVREK